MNYVIRNKQIKHSTTQKRGDEDMEFDRVELREKDGKGKIRINDTDIKSTTDYSLKRGADMIDVTLTISVPVKNFKTIED